MTALLEITQQRGCELQLYMPQKAGNMDCTLCMDCVKACPHDNIGLFAIPPVRDVLRDPVRSSIGKFSVAHRHRRARSGAGDRCLCECLVDGGAGRRREVPGAGSSVLQRRLARCRWPPPTAPSRKELFCRFSQALLPLGIAMWAAHLLFHLFTGWATLGPALHQAAADLGWHFLRAGSLGNGAAALAGENIALGAASAAGCRAAFDPVPGLETGAAVG